MASSFVPIAFTFSPAMHFHSFDWRQCAPLSFFRLLMSFVGCITYMIHGLSKLEWRVDVPLSSLTSKPPIFVWPPTPPTRGLSERIAYWLRHCPLLLSSGQIPRFTLYRACFSLSWGQWGLSIGQTARLHRCVTSIHFNPKRSRSCTCFASKLERS